MITQMVKEVIKLKKYLVFIERKETFAGNSIPEHRNFIQTLRERQVLITAGGFADQSGGAYLISADTLEEALAIVHQDPMYVENECLYKVKEWLA